jgi:TRAP-type uncharacterized transport system substrate-binding protein
MIAILFIILCLVFLLFLFYRRRLFEGFQPAWYNHVIYNQLKSRLRLGIWKEWINVNRLQFMDKLINITNIEIKLYEDNQTLLNDLLVEKAIDIAFMTEADYGMFILNNLKKDLDVADFRKETLFENREFIQQKYPASRLFTLYPVYRTLVTNHLTIGKPDDINNKTIQITNISNNLNLLDQELLNKYDYKKVFREEEQTENRYENIKALQGKVDGYFATFNNPDENLQILSNYAKINLIDLYDDTSESDEITQNYFFLKKDKMDLSYYPQIVQRREQTFDYYQLPYTANRLNCYSYRTLLLSRSDVNDEYIYQFTKKLYEHIDYLKKAIPYFNVDKKQLYQSSIDSIIPTHTAVYKPK